MSEFGKGLLYPIGLFLKHAERNYNASTLIDAYPGGENEYWSMWWYGAADHLLELQIPESLPDSIKTKAHRLSDIATRYRLPFGESPKDNKEKAAEAIGICTEILLEADGVLGIDAQKGDWE